MRLHVKQYKITDKRGTKGEILMKITLDKSDGATKGDCREYEVEEWIAKGDHYGDQFNALAVLILSKALTTIKETEARLWTTL